MGFFTPGKRTHPFLLSQGLILSGAAHSDVALHGCNGCHGTDGVSRADYIPSIAGLNFRYFYATMQAFKKDRRRSTVMGTIAKGFRSSQLQMMALEYGAQAWPARLQADVDTALAEKGRKLHLESCEECHKQNGYFQDKDTPPLAGQAKGYLLNQMRDYRVAATIMPQPPLMQERLEKLSDEDLMALAEFFASPLTKQAEWIDSRRDP